MQKQLKTWSLLLESIQQETPAMLLYVLESKGSSPGRQGFFMGVNGKGAMEGSIGGGIMEFKFVEMAKQHLADVKYKLVTGEVRKQVHDKSAPANQSGMICSGEQTIFLYPVSKKDQAHIEQIILSISGNKNGSLHLSPGKLSFSNSVPAKNFEFNNSSEENWYFIEKTGYKNHLSIVGGGHCALAFSKLMSDMDFYITVFEERETLNTIEQNNYAHEIIIIDDYAALKNLVPSGPNQYMVIMTMGYRTDNIAIRALAEKNFKYFGVLGSNKKMEKLLNEYKEQGLSFNSIDNMHAPVGLNISSQTPQEIAVSIAAEIIKTKNG